MRILNLYLFWSNFYILPYRSKRNHTNVAKTTKEMLTDYHKIQLPLYVKDKRKLLRNAVSPEIGKHILDCFRKEEASII